MKRVLLEEKLSVTCPKCGAKPGDECTAKPSMSIRGNLATITFAYRLQKPHPERREEFLRKPHIDVELIK